MSATVRLNDGCAIVMDPVKGSAHTTRGVLVSIEGRTPGTPASCALIPLASIGAVIASLALAAEQAARQS